MENDETLTKALSKKLLYCAIVFEIIAVAAGLAIAAGALYEAVEGSPQHTPGLVLNASLGALPFALAALAEGTKIPLTFSFFNATGAWRIVIAVTLIAIAGITFENTVTGFERAYTVRAASVESLQERKAAIDQGSRRRRPARQASRRDGRNSKCS